FNELVPVMQDVAPFTLTATVDSDLQITYSSDNTAVATVNGNTVTVHGIGTTNIIAAQTGDETHAAASVSRQLLVTTVTAVEPSPASQVKMYPNPTTGLVTIEVPTTKSANVEIDVYNTAGVTVMQRTAQPVEGKISLDMSSVQQGVYLVRVASGSIQVTQR